MVKCSTGYAVARKQRKGNELGRSEEGKDGRGTGGKHPLLSRELGLARGKPPGVAVCLLVVVPRRLQQERMRLTILLYSATRHLDYTPTKQASQFTIWLRRMVPISHDPAQGASTEHPETRTTALRPRRRLTPPQRPP
jgi:hypothetical protein